MTINFELILTAGFALTGVFWLANRWVFKHREGPIEFMASLAAVLGIVLILRTFMFEPFQIPSKSMVPTLRVGDFILVSKSAYGLRLPVVRYKIFDLGSPERGDVVVFFPPHEERYFIKRLIGLPGDEVRVVAGVVYINGEKMPQMAIDDTPDDDRSVIMREQLKGTSHQIQKRLSPTRLSLNFTAVVPEGHYFMMGDNRDNSSDSRVWGPVPADRIVGKAFARWLFWDEFLSIPNFSRAGWID
ncbi:MAG: signal peptidase I [Cellvibrionales bacterium]|tara:strand:+ start:36300 stop:37031 length:732 start_codon:yes stop_codon:yes gene_type:complete